MAQLHNVASSELILIQCDAIARMFWVATSRDEKPVSCSQNISKNLFSIWIEDMLRGHQIFFFPMVHKGAKNLNQTDCVYFLFLSMFMFNEISLLN